MLYLFISYLTPHHIQVPYAVSAPLPLKSLPHLCTHQADAHFRVPPAYPDIRQPVTKHIGNLAVLYPAAGIHIPGGEDGQVAVAAVAAAVDHTVLHGFGDFECPGFVLVQRPQVIFLIKVGLAACGLIFLEFLVAVSEQLAVAQRLDAHILFLAGGAVTGEGKDIHTCCHNSVDDAGDLVNVRAGNGGHHHGANARPIDAADLLQRNIKAAGLAEPVVGFTQAVNGKLIFFAAVVFQAAADFIRQVEGVAQNGEGDVVFRHQSQQLPEIRVQNGVAAGDVEIRQTVIDLAEVQAVVEGVLHLLPGHCIQLLVAVFRENVAVLAPLVAFIRDMPLERKILFHVILLVVMGRLSESVTAVALSEIRPKFFLVVYPLNFPACRQHRRQSRKQQASQWACRQHRTP